MNKVKDKFENIVSILSVIMTAVVIIALILIVVIVLIPFFLIGVIVMGLKKIKRLIHRSYRLFR